MNAGNTVLFSRLFGRNDDQQTGGKVLLLSFNTAVVDKIAKVK